MKMPRFLVLICCLVTFSTLAVGPAGAADAILGMDISGSGTKPEEQQAFLKRVHDAGVRNIRAWVLSDAGLNLIREAYAMGMKVHLTVPIHFRPDATKRAAAPDVSWVTPTYPISAADPARTAAEFANTLGKLEAEGIVLLGFEVGNEINNAPFNGDFAVHSPGDKTTRNMGYDDLKRDAEGQRIAAGYRTYIDVLKAVRAVRDHSKLNRNTPLVSGGLADWGPERSLPNSRIQYVSLNASLRMLREFGLDGVVDAYGIHTYPSFNHPGDPKAAAERLDALARDTLAQCAPAGAGKPCWITEWGFKNTNEACPTDDSSRAQLMREMMGDFKAYVKEGRLLGLFCYDWSEDPPGHQDPFSVYRCGGVTPSAKIAIDASLLR